MGKYRDTHISLGIQIGFNGAQLAFRMFRIPSFYINITNPIEWCKKWCSTTTPEANLFIWGFPKMGGPWYPTTMGFPTKNDDFGV